METKKFISPKRNLRIIIRAAEGETKWSPKVEGKSVYFDNGIYETSDKEVINWLRDNNEYGSLFWEMDDKEVMKDIGKSFGMLAEGSEPVVEAINKLDPKELAKIAAVLSAKAEEGASDVAEDNKQEDGGSDEQKEIEELKQELKELKEQLLGGEKKKVKSKKSDK